MSEEGRSYAAQAPGQVFGIENLTRNTHFIRAMSLILNILWFILGGALSGLAWIFAGILMAITIVGLPWARSCFMLANFSFFPFGRDVVSRRDLHGRDDLGTGTLGVIGNLIWFVLCGWWLAIWHISAAVALGITIIGIPFAIQHVKLAIASLFPIGKSVVSYDRPRLTPGRSVLQP